jgi:outer membrane protein OmpA-like peptidoglycan-associated protein
MQMSDAGPSVGSATGIGSETATDGKANPAEPQVLAAAAPEPIPMDMVADYMDRQEEELHQQFESTESAAVRRDRDYVFITFKSDLLFDPDSMALTAEALEQIGRLAGVLKRYPQTRVRVNGFTDSIGSERRNLELSLKRAMAVQNALVQNGIDPNRIRTRGFGEAKPIRSNATDSGRLLNRRVTVVIVPNRS